VILAHVASALGFSTISVYRAVGRGHSMPAYVLLYCVESWTETAHCLQSVSYPWFHHL